MEARKLAAMTEEQIWQLKDGPLTVVFDDGKLKTTSRRVIFSYYAWEFHRRYPNTPLLTRHCLQDPYVTGNSNLKLVNAAMWDCYDSHVGSGIIIEQLTKISYEASNRLYNAITRRLETHVTSISALDFLDVIDHPAIREANENVKPSSDTDDHTVDNTYTVIEKVLLDPKEMRDNGVAKAARSGLVSMGQILQCVGPRGYATDIDSNIFRNPILTGFYHGLRSLEDMMKESRSAAKALFFTKDPMQKSEYFNRNLQLSAATLSNLHMGDCGSTHFIPFTVKAGDINPGLLGIYFKNDKGKLEMITMGHKHLIGKTIEIRSVFGCLHPDPYGVCSTCFGDLALSFPPNTNIGHFCSAVVQGEVGQRILSTKHEDGSSTVETQPLDDYTRRYIRVFGDENQLGLSPRTDGAKVTLTIPDEGAKNLFDITFVDDVKSLVTFRITEISRMRMTIQKKSGKIENAVLNIANGPRNASFTHEALQFIKARGWSNTHNGEYVIDVSGWDTSIPMFELPLTHHNMVEYMKTIEKVVKGTGDNDLKTLMDCDSPAEALSVLYELVSSKMDVSLSHLQVIALTTMAVDPDNDDYRIPKPGMVGKFAAYKDYMAMRSLSSMMAFQRQSPTLLSIKSFNVRIRPKHPLDPLLLE
jgi:hypothetical protein